MHSSVICPPHPLFFLRTCPRTLVWNIPCPPASLSLLLLAVATVALCGGWTLARTGAALLWLRLSIPVYHVLFDPPADVIQIA